MRACRVLLALFCCTALFADNGVRLQWMPKSGDRYTFRYTDSIATTGRADGQSLNTHLDAAMEGELDVASASDTDGAVGTLHLKTLSATASKVNYHKEVSLTEKDLKSQAFPFKLDKLGTLTIDGTDWEQVGQGVDLAEHFAGLLFTLPGDPLKKNQQVKIDRNSFEIDLTYKSDHIEGGDQVVILDGQAKTKTGQWSQSNRATGTVTIDFDVTKGYMPLLKEDLDTKVERGENRMEVKLQRTIEMQRIGK